MGSGQSQESLRSTHFQRPSGDEEDDQVPYEDEDEDINERKISISNRMVERLVEDATLAGRAEAKANHVTPHGDFKDKVYVEKLKCLDENHSQRFGLTVRDMETAAARIEKRIERMANPEPVCDERQKRLIECYRNARMDGDYVKCWGVVEDFKRCVSETSTARQEKRTQRDEREYARRSRHCAHARERVLRDLGPDDTDV